MMNAGGVENSGTGKTVVLTTIEEEIEIVIAIEEEDEDIQDHIPVIPHHRKEIDEENQKSYFLVI